MYYPYIRPQQNGNRSDVRTVTLYNEKQGLSLTFSADNPFDFSALHFPDEDFDPGMERKIIHTKDIYPHRETYVILDNVLRGVGGDNSWGELPHMQYRHFSDNYQFTFNMRLNKMR